MLVRPWAIPLVVLFWCISSGWLLTAKIIPSLVPGAPPGQQAVHAPQGQPVGWTVLWNEQPLGWALSQSHQLDDGGLDVESVLHFDRLPMDKVLPSWTKPLLRQTFDPETVLTLDARGRLSIDVSGTLRAFRSAITIPALSEQIVLNGMIDDGLVTVLVSAGDSHYSTSRRLPRNISLGDELSPQAMLPGLAANRRWTVPVYSPLRFGQSPIEMLYAHVAGEETMFWDDSLVRVDVVHYRDDPSQHHEPRCRLWVDRSGKVLKQESVVLGSRLVFLRRSDEAAERLLSLVESHPEAAPIPADDEAAADGSTPERTSRAGPS